MRVIAGKWKRRLLEFPPDKSFRPTQDRAKEALFSRIHPLLAGAKVLDLCCGSGSLGIEALSRGASSCVFVDLDIRYASKNLTTLDALSQATLVRQSITVFLTTCVQKEASIVFLDPPWWVLHEGNRLPNPLFDHTLKLVEQFDILSEQGILVCEHPSSLRLNAHYTPTHSNRYGQTTITIFSRKDLL